jgi:cell division protein FtsQ
MLQWRPGKGFAAASIALGVFALLGTFGYWAWTSPFFEVSNVKVEGNDRITAAEIANRSDLLGERIFTADLGEAQRALYALPLISNVTIEREWPDAVRVTVVERRAWGIWQQDLVNYTIDRDGVVIGTTSPGTGAAVIVSDEHGALALGERVDYQAVDSAAELYERLPRQLGTTVVEVRFLGPRGVQVTTADGQVAFLGDSGGMSYKLAVWAAMAVEAERQGIKYTSIDLRYGNRPVLQ